MKREEKGREMSGDVKIKSKWYNISIIIISLIPAYHNWIHPIPPPNDNCCIVVVVMLDGVVSNWGCWLSTMEIGWWWYYDDWRWWYDDDDTTIRWRWYDNDTTMMIRRWWDNVSMMRRWWMMLWRRPTTIRWRRWWYDDDDEVRWMIYCTEIITK